MRAVVGARCFSVCISLLASLGLLGLVTPHARAQSPAPLPAPDLVLADTGQVFAVARTPDGGVVIGGTFSRAGGAARNHIAKFLADGSLDPAWQPVVSGTVSRLVVDSDGTVFALLSNGFVRKIQPDASGTVDPGWTVSAISAIFALELDGAGSVVVGGNFTTIGGQPRNRLAKFSISTPATLDAWAPAVTGTSAAVRTLHRDAALLYVGGTFSNVAGSARPNIARLNASGPVSVDVTWNPGANGNVQLIRTDPLGTVYAAGSFTIIGAASRNGLAKLSGTGSGSADLTWNPATSGSYSALAPDAAFVYVGGGFSSLGGASRSNIAKLAATGTGAADAAWNPGASDPINALALDASASEVYAGGGFTLIGGQGRSAFATLAAANGAVDPALQDATVPGSVAALLRHSNGGTIVGGRFRYAGVAQRRHLLRLLPDGTLDPAWAPQAPGAVTTLAEGNAGAVFVGNSFSNGLQKLDGGGTGATIPGFVTTTSVPFTAQALAPGGTNLYVGGNFGGGATSARFVRIDQTNGSLTGFVPPFTGTVVRAISVTPGDLVFIGGTFTQYNGQARQNLALLAGGSLVNPDALWNPGANGGVKALLLDGLGSIFVTGQFGTIGGQARPQLAKLAASGTGSVDPWTNEGANGNALALAPDGALYVATGQLHQFASFGAGTRNRLFNPSPDAAVNALALGATVLTTGGDFLTIGGQPRTALAALPLTTGAFTSTRILSDDPDPSIVGSSYTIQFEVTAIAGTPIGTVTVTDGTNSCGPVALVAGAGSCNLLGAAASTFFLTATYAPTDSNVFAASSDTEPHEVAVIDWGDAPASYATLSANNGARHVAVGADLGGSRDGEADGQPSAGADGDDLNGTDDEGGVTVPTLFRGTAADISVSGDFGSFLNAWIDWNADGIFSDPGERIAGDFDPFAGTLQVSVPGGSVPGFTYARFRVGPAGLGPTGLAASGEVEDYRVAVARSLPQVSNPGPRSTLEDTASAPISFNVSDADSSVVTLTFTTTSNNQALVADSGLAITPGFNVFEKLLTVTPVAQANTTAQGTATITFTATDIDGDATAQQFQFTVTAVNDAPSFQVGAGPAWPAGSTAGPRSHPGFVTSTNLGPPDEAGQTVLSYQVTEVSDPSGVLNAAAIDVAGTLSYSLSGNLGTATLEATLRDSGGSANSGVDTSAPIQFNVRVTSASADFAISKTDGTTLVSLGQPVSYAIVAQNLGPDPVLAVRVQDTVPANLLGAAWTCSAGAGANCPASGNGSIDALVDLPVGATTTFTLNGTMGSSGVTLSNTATITAPVGTNDAVASNNSATDTDDIRIFANGFEGP